MFKLLEWSMFYENWFIIFANTYGVVCPWCLCRSVSWENNLIFPTFKKSLCWWRKIRCYFSQKFYYFRGKRYKVSCIINGIWVVLILKSHQLSVLLSLISLVSIFHPSCGRRKIYYLTQDPLLMMQNSEWLNINNLWFRLISQNGRNIR